jgi:hypothetical protein
MQAISGRPEGIAETPPPVQKARIVVYMDRPVTSVVGVREVPQEIRSLSTMNEPDYVDMYSLASAAATTETTAETWARAMYEDTLGARGRFIFGGILGLELAKPKAAGTVAGWRITDHGEDWIRLDAGGRRIVGQIVVRAVDGELSVTTFIKFVSRLGSTVWRLWSPLHHKAMPRLLRDAAEKVEV